MHTYREAIKRKAGSSSNNSAGKIMRVSQTAFFNRQRFVLPLVILDNDFSSKSMNIRAWESFNVAWCLYIESIVIPCCNQLDRECFEIIKTWDVPPTTMTKLSRFSHNYKSKCRMWYLMYNIIDNCIYLNIDVPSSLYLLRVEDGKFYMKDNKKKLRSSEKKLLTPLSSSRKRPRDIDPLSRSGRRNDNIMREQALANEIRRRREIDFDFERIKQEAFDEFSNKKAWISSHAKHFSKVHEHLNAVGGGTPGSIQTVGSFNLSWYINELGIGNDIPQWLMNIIEEGVRTFDQARSNKIFFPHAAHFGYEFDNFLHFSLFDQENTDKSWMELDILNSIWSGEKVSHAPYGFAFNIMYSPDSAKLPYTEFLTRP